MIKLLKLFTESTMFNEMKEAGLTPAEMVLEVLMCLALFAFPIGLLFLPQLLN